MRCVKLQVQKQPDANYLFFVCVGVFTQTAFTLASPHLHAILAARRIETLFLRRCERILSRSLAQAEPESPAWRRIFNRPASADESAAFLQLIGVLGEELAAVSKSSSSRSIVQWARPLLRLSVPLQTVAAAAACVPSRMCQNVTPPQLDG